MAHAKIYASASIARDVIHNATGNRLRVWLMGTNATKASSPTRCVVEARRPDGSLISRNATTKPAAIQEILWEADGAIQSGAARIA